MEKFAKLASLNVTKLDGTVVPASSLWENGGAVVYLIRRMGCKLCREESLALSELKDRLAPVPLIGIAGEHLGHEEFTEKYWKGGLFFDLGKKDWFPIMGSGRMMFSGLASYMFGGVVAKNVKRVDEKNIEGNFAGEGFNLGGVWVVNAIEKKVVFEHQEKSWGDNVCGDPAQFEKLLAEVDRIKSAMKSSAK